MHVPPDIPTHGASRALQSHSKFTKSGCFLQKVRVCVAQRGSNSAFLRVFCQLCKINNPFYPHPPHHLFFLFCFSLSLFSPVTFAHSQVDGGVVGGVSLRYLRQVCERRGVISARGTSLSEPVSGHIHKQETAADAGGGMRRSFAHGRRWGGVTRGHTGQRVSQPLYSRPTPAPFHHFSSFPITVHTLRPARQIRADRP